MLLTAVDERRGSTGSAPPVWPRRVTALINPTSGVGLSGYSTVTTVSMPSRKWLSKVPSASSSTMLQKKM